MREILIILLLIMQKASRGVEAQSVTVIDRLWVRSLRENEIFILHLYFHFFALVSRQKRGVEFRHLTRNTSRSRQKVPSTYPAVQYTI